MDFQIAPHPLYRCSTLQAGLWGALPLQGSADRATNLPSSYSGSGDQAEVPVIGRLIDVRFIQQTPPALPTLPLVQLAVRIQGSKLIIDWHNTAFSILAMRLGNDSPLTRFAER